MEELDLLFIISQIFVIISYSFLAITYALKDKKLSEIFFSIM